MNVFSMRSGVSGVLCLWGTVAFALLFPALFEVRAGGDAPGSPGWRLHTEPPPPDWSARFTRVTQEEVSSAVANGHGVAWGDYDGDGDLDLFIANVNQPSLLFRNQGDGTFARVTGQPLVEAVANSTVCAWGDYDNDGDLDMLVGNSGQQPFLWRNVGDGTFVQATDSGITIAPDQCYGAAWGDYDNDGWLDLIILNTWNCNYLFHNNCNGTFSRVTTGPVVAEAGAAVGCAWGDYDNDGWLDLFVAYGGGQNNRLYYNNRDGTFTQITVGEIVNDGGESQSCDWGDYDNDGWLDLFVANRLGNNFLYHNNGNGTFTRITDGRIVSDGGESNGCAWADFDNDGWLDLVVSNWQGHPNFVYRNNGDGTFTRITACAVAAEAAQSVGCAAGDYNGDGFVDLFISNLGWTNSFLFRNEPNGNNWLKIRCIGAGSNRSAIGARVRIKTTVGDKEMWQTRHISSASGWAGGHPEAVFGLGTAATVDLVRVEWPSGMMTEIPNPTINQVVTVSEPAALLVAEPNGGSYFDSVTVKLRTTIPGAEIRYTLNAGDPRPDSTLYTAGIELTQSAVLRAVVFTNGVAASPVLVRSYSLAPRSVVVPPGFAEKEDDGQSGILGYQPMRLQNVYGAQTLPQHPILVKELRFRRDASYGTPVTDGKIRARFTMSATAKLPDQLSTAMDENTGSDATVVFDGELTMTSSGPMVPGGPNPFDLVVPLQVPYVYNPYNGNLLIDIQVFETAGLSHTDASNDRDDNASRVFAYDPNASLASFSDTGADIIQLVYSDALPPIWLMPRPGPYDRSISLTISSGLTGAVIRFTLDGSEPTAESPAYEQPIRLSSTTTVKARVFVDGAPASDVVTGVYEITLTPPAITSELKTQTVVEGGNLTFTASVTGSPPLAYQWAFNGVPIASQTNNTLSLANVGFDNAGTYTLTVNNEVGTVSKDLLTLTVAPKPIPPTIVLQPKSIMVVTGSVATFTVVAAGTEPLSYQWRRGTTTVGMNSPTLTITDVKQSDAGTYRVKVLNPIGSVYSDYATLQVFDTHVAPQITSAPTYARVNVGERVVFSAEFTGTLPLACQWYKNGVPIEGATNSTLTIEAAQLADQGTYVLVVTNPAGSATTPGAVLYLWPTEIGGTVNFNNLATPSGVDAPIYDSDGTTKLSGAAFLAQLYAGKTPDQLVPVGPAVPFESGIAAGYVCQRFTSRTIPFVAPGDPVFVQVRVWETAFGATYEAAVLAGGKTGTSDILNVVTGGAGSPPSLPGDLAGLKSFSVKRETVPPTVVIESPVAGTTTDERVTLTGVVTDNTRVESARWELNGRPMGTLALDAAGRFNQTGVRLHRGENVIRVVGRDSAGNEATADVVVVWQPLRELALVGPESDQEGRLIDFDLVLRSPGDVAGLSFAMSFSTDQFRNASFAWSDAVSGASGQVNLDVPGEIQATLSLPGTAIPAGTVRLGTLSLRARSVPASQAQTVSLNLQDLADTLGNRILFGSDALPAVVTVLPRKIRGDNNGNDRLDIGDATVIQRYLVGLDLARPWDIVGNDLNQEAGQDPALDSGDVIKVLRAVVGLDPQPKPAEVGRGLAQDRHWALMDVANNSSPTAALHSVESSGPWATAKTLVSADRMRAAVGETLVVRVQLNDLPARISGAVFNLDYPGDSLVLREPVRAGAMVPTAPTPAVTWRTQDGSVAGAKEVVAAISSAQAWPNTSGVVAELTFEVAPTASFKAVWPVVVESLEVTTSDGYDLYTLPGSAIALNPLPILTQDIAVSADGVHGSFTGLSGSNYRVEVSNDLITWGPLATGVNTSGTVLFHDPFATQFPARFYRVIEW